MKKAAKLGVPPLCSPEHRKGKKVYCMHRNSGPLQTITGPFTQIRNAFSISASIAIFPSFRGAFSFSFCNCIIRESIGRFSRVHTIWGGVRANFFLSPFRHASQKNAFSSLPSSSSLAVFQSGMGFTNSVQSTRQKPPFLYYNCVKPWHVARG